MFELDMNKPKYWYKTRANSELTFLSAFIENIENKCKSDIKNYELELKTEVLEENEETNTYEEISHFHGFDSHSWDLDNIF